MSAPVLEYGYDRVRLKEGTRRRLADVRWWFYLEMGSFRFARGGRAQSVDEAKQALEPLYEEARAEMDEYRFRPTHRLGPDGTLVPLAGAPMELTR